jgi:hypothetical protein
VWPLSDFSYSPVSKSHTFRVASSLADTITLKTGWNITCKRKYRSINYIHYLEILTGKDKRFLSIWAYYVITADLYTVFRGHFCSHTFISVATQAMEALLQPFPLTHTKLITEISMEHATMIIPRTSSLCLHSFWLTSQTWATVSLWATADLPFCASSTSDCWSPLNA